MTAMHARLRREVEHKVRGAACSLYCSSRARLLTSAIGDDRNISASRGGASHGTPVCKSGTMPNGTCCAGPDWRSRSTRDGLVAILGGGRTNKNPSTPRDARGSDTEPRSDAVSPGRGVKCDPQSGERGAYPLASTGRKMQRGPPWRGLPFFVFAVRGS